MDTSSAHELAGGLRLCYLRKWPDYEGYGFSLRENEQNYFITAVVPDSPAELGGLRNDDRLIEVNAVSVENRSYQEIMWRISKEPDQVDLLVIDHETDEAFASRQQKPSGQADGVLRRWTPARRPRLTFMKTKKQTSKVEAAGTGGFVIPHAIESANDAEHDKAISEEDLVVKEGVGQKSLATTSSCHPVHVPELRQSHSYAEKGQHQQQRILVHQRRVIGNHVTYCSFSNCLNETKNRLESPVQLPCNDTDNYREAHMCFTILNITCTNLQESADGLRLCHLSKWPNFEGYGFALKAERLRDGQFVAHVDLGSPAHLGGLRKRDRIVEVNGESVEGASYRDVVNRIKLDPGKVALLVIDRETDEAFAHQNRTPNSRDDCVVECRTPPVQPPPYATASGSRHPVPLDPGKVALLVIDRETDEAFAHQNRTPNSRDDCVVEYRTPPVQPPPYATASGSRHPVPETPKTPLKSDVSTVVSSDKLNDRSTTAEKPQENKLINSFWPPKPASQSVPLLVARPMNLVAPKSRQHEDEDDSQRDQQPKHQPAKTKLHGIASKPFPSMSNTNEPSSLPTPASSTFMTSHHPASAELHDNSSPLRSPTRSASEYFSAQKVLSSIPSSTKFSPTESYTPMDSPLRPMSSTANRTSSAPGSVCYTLNQHCDLHCPVQSWSFQLPYAPLEMDLQQERTTTYAPGYSDFLSMYSGYASSEPLNSATEMTNADQATTERHCTEDAEKSCNVVGAQSSSANTGVHEEP
ncbi:hypothetical protein HPB51_029089 [Rhipicephalus microplus]|uniref:PDZ domain-containing protein n=1 Tax=Rhipicephalus microplus TaxID=6941 RepID=A0A9J6CVM9_RHIMP|nr:hypothetical protein HPB51_029089 [Rhipicephalus microplus]